MGRTGGKIVMVRKFTEGRGEERGGEGEREIERATKKEGEKNKWGGGSEEVDKGQRG